MSIRRSANNFVSRIAGFEFETYDTDLEDTEKLFETAAKVADEKFNTGRYPDIFSELLLQYEEDEKVIRYQDVAGGVEELLETTDQVIETTDYNEVEQYVEETLSRLE